MIPEKVYVWIDDDKDVIFELKKDDKSHYNILSRYKAYTTHNSKCVFVALNDKFSFVRYPDDSCIYLNDLIWHYSLEECLDYRKNSLKLQIEELNDKLNSSPEVN